MSLYIKPNLSNTLNSKCGSSETKPLNNNVKGTLTKPRCTVGKKGVATEDGGGSGGQAGKMCYH